MPNPIIDLPSEFDAAINEIVRDMLAAAMDGEQACDIARHARRITEERIRKLPSATLLGFVAGIIRPDGPAIDPHDLAAQTGSVLERMGEAVESEVLRRFTAGRGGNEGGRC